MRAKRADAYEVQTRDFAQRAGSCRTCEHAGRSVKAIARSVGLDHLRQSLVTGSEMLESLWRGTTRSSDSRRLVVLQKGNGGQQHITGAAAEILRRLSRILRGGGAQAALERLHRHSVGQARQYQKQRAQGDADRNLLRRGTLRAGLWDQWP